MQTRSSSLPLPLLLLLKWNLRVILSPISCALHYSWGKVKTTCVDVFCSPPWHAELIQQNSCKVAISGNLLGGDMLLGTLWGGNQPLLVFPLPLHFIYFPLFPSVIFSMTLSKCSIDNYISYLMIWSPEIFHCVWFYFPNGYNIAVISWLLVKCFLFTVHFLVLMNKYCSFLYECYCCGLLLKIAYCVCLWAGCWTFLEAFFINFFL